MPVSKIKGLGLGPYRSFLIWALICSVLISPIEKVSAEVLNPKLLDIVVLQAAGKVSGKSNSDLVNGIVSDVIPHWSSNGIKFQLGESSSKPLVLATPINCSGNQVSSQLINIRKSFYQEINVADSSNRYLIAIAPNAGCIWEGVSLLANDVNSGGVVLLEDNISPFVISHELGHALGLGHSNLLQCASGAKDGAWSQDCKGVEYGGAIDLMSNVDNRLPLSTYHQWRIGLLDSKNVVQNWVEEKITLNAVDSKTGNRAIFIRDGNSTYWVEYRKAALQNGYKPGLVIYRTDPLLSRFISSPNPEDSSAENPGPAVATDIWMLNLDDYRYSQGRTSGSMTLTTERSFTTHSGLITFTVGPGLDLDSVEVSVSRKPDTIPPKKPLLVEKSRWTSADSSIISESYLNSEFDIRTYEVQINGKISMVQSESSTSWTPTFLNPLRAPASVLVRNLPEGEYSLSVRAIDFSSNVSPWSDAISVYIDRSFPKISSTFTPSVVTGKGIEVLWSGTQDLGSGLCNTRVVNEDDFVLQQDFSKADPKLVFPLEGVKKYRVEVYDCLGNGISSQIQIDNRFLPASKSKRTSKWTQEKDISGLTKFVCSGSCTASTTVRGNFVVLAGSGSPDLLLSGKRIGKVNSSGNGLIKMGYQGTTDNRSKVLRISGKNFSFYGIATYSLKVKVEREILRRELAPDASLEDSKQVLLMKRGFSASDFGGNWNVLPMARGTTLLDPTLDLCKARYESDQNRLERRQVTVFKEISPYLFLSSEVVRYKDSKSALEAFNELEAQVNKCKSDSGAIDASGRFESHTFLEFPRNVAIGASGTKKVFVRVNIGSEGNARSLIGLYQFFGDIFSGIYVVRDGSNAFSDDEVVRWLEAAALVEDRLKG